LHVQVPYSPWLAGRLISAAAPSTAIIGTFHIVALSPLVNAATRFLGLYTHSTVRKFDEIVSVSSAAQGFSKQTYGVATDVVPNAMDYQRFHVAKPLAKYDDDTVTILFLGRLVPRKGCAQLLVAIRLLKEESFDAKFRVVICGKGPELQNLQKMSADSGLNNMVEFVGFVSEADKPAYYASADIAVFPSSGGESFGIVLIEAMASGKACVLAADNSGYASTMETQPDLLFDRFNAEVLAKKLHYYLTKSEQRRAMAAWGSEYARQFDQAVVGEQLVIRYQKALQKRRHPEIL
jgi:phosphatidylinositol alpha-mannosyltransferase